MARRSSGVVDAGTPGYPPGGFAPADPWDAPEEKGRRGKGRRGSGGGGGGGRGGWGGSGGRWLVYVGRVILWAFLIVVLVNGIRAPFERFTAKPTTPAAPTTGKPVFPSEQASAYALSFADVYLNYDSATAADRQKQLAQFIAPGVDPQLGWDNNGKSVLRSAHVASVEAQDANQAIVTLLAQANGKLFQLAVPVYAKDGAFAISGRPATLPAPPRAALPTANEDRDSAVETELQEPLAGFFKAYASGDAASLQRYSDPPVTGLGNAFAFSALKEIIAPRGDANSRTVNATVIWQVAPVQNKASGGSLEQTYQLSMAKKDGNWYVTDIRGSTLPAAS
jgi:Conjugative transposon protein TcpC